MIDVLCCLLIFFMLSTQFVRWGALEIQVAGRATSVNTQDKKLTSIKLYLSIDKVQFHKKELTLAKLTQKLKASKVNLNKLDVRLFVSKKTQLQFAVDVVPKITAVRH
ncbi:biopolymer transporter ExbD [Piscirickettsia litoralis]|uniref:Biopolymer transporter ExbD n=2 Tax=Piscirickettsia litoralis TaxID=1891921 RepID=A0ABX3A555_9GAMM|nr:biopolymer transporter ExbD [Piscirickettsia litoralis]